MRNKRQLLTIKAAKIIKAKYSKRYGLRLKLAIDGKEELTFYHIIWLGNYLDFQEDHANKSALMWFHTINTFKQMKLPSEAHKKTDEIIDYSFYGMLGVDNYGICLDAISEDQKR